MCCTTLTICLIVFCIMYFDATTKLLNTPFIESIKLLQINCTYIFVCASLLYFVSFLVPYYLNFNIITN